MKEREKERERGREKKRERHKLNQFSAGHPRFFNQLSCGLDIISLAGEWLTATANTNMFTYEIAPVFILMEHECLKVRAVRQYTENIVDK